MTGYAKFLNSNRSDEKYTPRYAVLPIMKYLPKDVVVWCPFDTANSEFVLGLEGQGFKVVYSHLLTGQDFFSYEPDYWDVIVSNPPFSSKVRVFERCLSFGKPFALLMSNFWLNNSAPYRLFKTRTWSLCSLINGSSIMTRAVRRLVRVMSVTRYCPGRLCLRN